MVADTGIGIPAEHLPHVFDKFFRVPDPAEAGTGLGLAIVKRNRHRPRRSGRCDSEPGKGTVFRLTLPMWKGVDRPTANDTFQRRVHVIPTGQSDRRRSSSWR